MIVLGIQILVQDKTPPYLLYLIRLKVRKYAHFLPCRITGAIYHNRFDWLSSSYNGRFLVKLINVSRCKNIIRSPHF